MTVEFGRTNFCLEKSNKTSARAVMSTAPTPPEPQQEKVAQITLKERVLALMQQKLTLFTVAIGLVATVITLIPKRQPQANFGLAYEGDNAIALPGRDPQATPRTQLEAFAFSQFDQGMSYLKRGMPQEACAPLYAATQARAEFWPAHVALSSALLQSRGRADEAERVLASLPDSERSEPWNALNIGVIYQERGQAELAVSHYTNLINRNKADLDRDPLLASAVWGNLGNSRFDLGEYDAAIVAHDKARELGPQSSKVLMNLGNAERLAAKQSEGVGRDKLRASALTHLRRAHDLDPSSDRITANLAAVYSDAGDHATVVNLLKPIAEPFAEGMLGISKEGNVYYNLAYSMAKSQREFGYADAKIRGYFLEAVRLEPRSAIFRSGYAEWLQGKDDLAGAIIAYSQAIALAPKFYVPVGNLSRCFEAVAKTKDFKPMLDLANRAIALNPRSSSDIGFKGYVLLLRNQNEEALPLLIKARSLNPSNAVAWYNEACYYGRSGNPSKAGDRLRRAWHIPELREMYRSDADFNSVRSSPEFRKALGVQVSVS